MIEFLRGPLTIEQVNDFIPAVNSHGDMHSYATEGAKASLDYGFKKCGLKEIISFTVPANVRSIRIMEKIGLKRDLNGDFAHPKLPADHHLSQHILYRLSEDEYLHQVQETR